MDNRSLRWRLWIAAVVFPAVTIALPAYVVWVWLLPGLVESMGPGGAASGSWVAWALLAIGVVSSGTSLVVALTTSWRIIRLAWQYGAAGPVGQGGGDRVGAAMLQWSGGEWATAGFAGGQRWLHCRA